MLPINARPDAPGAGRHSHRRQRVLCAAGQRRLLSCGLLAAGTAAVTDQRLRGLGAGLHAFDRDQGGQSGAGISAFQSSNQRSLDVDEEHAYYRVHSAPGAARAHTGPCTKLGVPHGLHVPRLQIWACRANVDTTAGHDPGRPKALPIHLTHVQFHSYGTEGDRKFSSAAGRIAEAINANPNVSADVGQIMFRPDREPPPGDSMAQFRNAGTSAHRANR